MTDKTTYEPYDGDKDQPEPEPAPEPAEEPSHAGAEGIEPDEVFQPGEAEDDDS